MYISKTLGIDTVSCQPYVSYYGTVPSYSSLTQCRDGSTYRKYKAKNFYYLLTINQINTILFNYGSVEVWFTVYNDFMNYQSGVYKRQSNSRIVEHAVKIVGWSLQNGVEHTKL